MSDSNVGLYVELLGLAIIIGAVTYGLMSLWHCNPHLVLAIAFDYLLVFALFILDCVWCYSNKRGGAND